MKKAALVAAMLLSAASSPQQSTLTGTWVADLGSQQGLPTDVYLIRDGFYSCDSCVPPRGYPADGRLRPLAAAPTISEAATIVDSRTLATRIVQPDLVRTTTMRVARDGQSATYVSIDRRAGIQGRLRTEYIARRTAAAPAGSHLVSGAWQGIRYISVPLQLRTTVLIDRGDQLVYRTGTGYSYTARFGGEFVPISGPYDGSISVSVRRLDSYQVEETRRQGAHNLQVRTYAVSRDGRSMEIATTNLASNTTFRVTARRQRGP